TAEMIGDRRGSPARGAAPAGRPLGGHPHGDGHLPSPPTGAAGLQGGPSVSPALAPGSPPPGQWVGARRFGSAAPVRAGRAGGEGGGGGGGGGAGGGGDNSGRTPPATRASTAS